MTTLRPPSIPPFALSATARLVLRALALLLVPALIAALVAGPFASGLEASLLRAGEAVSSLGG